MKKSILIIVILSIAALCFAGPLQEMHKRVIAGSTVAEVGGSCASAQAQSTIADYWPPSGTDYIAQGIIDDGSQTLCDIYVTIDSATEEICHLELWTTADRTGSQIGGDSDNFTVTNTQDGTLCTNGATQYQVGWDGNGWPSVTGGYYLHIVGNDGSPNFSWCANVTDTIYGPGNLSDNISRNAGTDLNADGVFDIHYE
jgi:hypothetical protein